MSESLLSVQHLSTTIATRNGLVRPVTDVNLEVGAGEVLGVVGESGSGKTMMALSLLGLLPRGAKVEKGRVLFKGKDLAAMSERQLRHIRGREISLIFQDPRLALDPIERCGDLIGEALAVNGRDPSGLLQVMEAAGIPVPEKTQYLYPFQLSEGMCQRVMAAVALACEPSLLIADEPTTNLDVTIQAGFIELLRQLQQQLNLTVVFISHNMGIVAEFCDHIAVMYAGTIVEYGPTEAVINQPKHPYTVGLLKCIPRIQSRAAQLARIPGRVPDLLAVPPGCVFWPRCEHAMDACKVAVPADVRVGESEVKCLLHAEIAP